MLEGATWPAESERMLLRGLCSRSLRAFARVAFGIAYDPSLSSRLTPNIHYALLDWLQYHYEDWQANCRPNATRKYLAVLVPREVWKSLLVTKNALMWMHVRDSDLATYIGSEKAELSENFLKTHRIVMSARETVGRYRWLYGSWEGQDTWNKGGFTHKYRKSLSKSELSFGTWGVESGLTGTHPDILCLDDPTTIERLSANTNWLDTVNAHMSSLSFVLAKNGMMILVGTRYHDGDHFGRQFRLHGVRSVTGMPMQGVKVTEDGLWDVFFWAARDIKGTPTVPKIWSEAALKREMKEDPAKYASQVMNNPAESIHNPLPTEKIGLLWLEHGARVPIRQLKLAMHLDTAFKWPSAQARGDETVIVISGHTRDGSGDVYYVDGAGSSIWTAEQTGAKILDFVEKYARLGSPIRVITDELTVGGKAGTWEAFLKGQAAARGLILPQFVTISRGGKKKVSRIIEAASFWQDGKVKLPRDAPGVDQLVQQMTQIGSSDHDDWADAFADAFHKDFYQTMHRFTLTGPEEDNAMPYDMILRGNPEDYLFDTDGAYTDVEHIKPIR